MGSSELPAAAGNDVGGNQVPSMENQIIKSNERLIVSSLWVLTYSHLNVVIIKKY